MPDAPRPSWIDQFVLRGPGAPLSPFRLTAIAGERLAHVAEDRSGLPRSQYESVGTARHQARLLAELARMLDEDVTALARTADTAPAGDDDPVARARVLSLALSGTVRATATLVDTCHSLLLLAEQLLVVRGLRSRLELLAAVEALRGAASTGHLVVLSNLPRLTDSVLYDELASGLWSIDVTLALADGVSRTIRSDVAVRDRIPA